MRKLTADYFIKQIIKSKTPADFTKASTNLLLYWASFWSYQYQKTVEQYK